LHTWHYCAHTHCAHDTIAYMKKKNRIFTLYTEYYCPHTDCTHDFIAHKHIAHMTLLRTYTLYTWFYCAHTHCTHDFIAHIHIAHMAELYTWQYCTHKIRKLYQHCAWYNCTYKIKKMELKNYTPISKWIFTVTKHCFHTPLSSWIRNILSRHCLGCNFWAVRSQAGRICYFFNNHYCLYTPLSTWVFVTDYVF